MSDTDATGATASAAPVGSGSVLNLVVFALSVGALVLAAMTLTAPLLFTIPIAVVLLTLSLLGAATGQSYALLGWISAVLSAVTLLLGILGALSA